MENLQVILILVVFLSGVALMMSKKLPAILSLPCMDLQTFIVYKCRADNGTHHT